MSSALRCTVRPAAVLAAGLAWCVLAGGTPGRAATDEMTDPLIGNSQAIAQGKNLYRRHCFICHLHAGGRGPNLFASQLSDRDFAATVMQGRGLMPAWGLRLSLDDIWKIRAYLRSTDKYED